MERTLFIHAGMHKTGTTALQHFLHFNRDILAENGLYYPLAGVPDRRANWGHHDIMDVLNKSADRSLLSDLRQECVKQPQIVLSSERFYGFKNPEIFTPLLRRFRKWTPKIVIYLRQQDRYVEAIYRQNVKANGMQDDILTFAKRIHRRLDFLALVNRLAEITGPEGVIVRPYEKSALAGDICTDFFQTIGHSIPDQAQRPKATKNPGLSREGIRLMIEANVKFAGKSDRLAEMRKALLSEHPAKTHENPDLLPDEIRAEMRERYRADNSEIAARFLPERGYLFESDR